MAGKRPFEMRMRLSANGHESKRKIRLPAAVLTDNLIPEIEPSFILRCKDQAVQRTFRRTHHLFAETLVSEMTLELALIFISKQSRYVLSGTVIKRSPFLAPCRVRPHHSVQDRILLF